MIITDLKIIYFLIIRILFLKHDFKVDDINKYKKIHI